MSQTCPDCGGQMYRLDPAPANDLDRARWDCPHCVELKGTIEQ